MKKPQMRFEVVALEDVLKTAVESDGTAIPKKAPKRTRHLASGAGSAQGSNKGRSNKREKANLS